MDRIVSAALNARQAEALFNEYSAVFGSKNVFPIYRAVELFGKEAAEWIAARLGNFLVLGTDSNSWYVGGGPHVDYLSFSGFLKLVSWHNCTILAPMCAEWEKILRETEAEGG